VPSHLTLVPPVNVRREDVPAALRVVREAAAATRPFRLRLGPPATFLPATPTLHLAVGGRGDATQVLRRLRDLCFRPPLERPLTFAFVPHVTLADDMVAERIAASLGALSGYVVEATFDRVHVLHEQRHGDAHRRWVPVADAPFAPAVVVGRGGVELDLAVTRLLDPEAAAFEGAAWPEDEPQRPSSTTPAGATSVVVTARRRGRVVGVARGWADHDHVELRSILVGPDERGQGIARHLMAAFRHAAAAGPTDAHPAR
jgi:2'-5' RNA ligase